MLSVKAREATDTIFKVLGMTKLRINTNQAKYLGLLLDYQLNFIV